jgi:hypothetical protein
MTFQATLLRRYFAGWRYAYPAYGVQSQYVNRRRTLPLKLPVLAASTSLRRSRKGQPAWMRAEGRVLHGRCLGPTRSLQG